MTTDITDTILSDPIWAAVVGAIVVTLFLASRYLDWEQYYRLHRLKIRFAPKLSPYFFTVSPKLYREDPEYIATLNGNVRQVWEQLIASGFDPHLLNSVKVRDHPEVGKQYSQAHAVFTHEDTDEDGNPEQTEVYLFSNPDGRTDLYSHFEGSVLDAGDHLEGGQTDGDPTGVVRDALNL